MIKPFFHTTPPKKTMTSLPLPSLYRQQRTLTAAKNVATDPTIHQAIERKQGLMSRRIAQLQIEEKTK